MQETASQIDGSVDAGIVLTANAYTDPVTITQTGTVSGSGIGLSAATDWTIVNHGTITVTGTDALTAGIALAGGQVSNDGTIAGISAGIVLQGGTVDNSGTIAGHQFGGVVFGPGGSDAITNHAGGVISGGAGAGVYMQGTSSPSATLDNSGTISGYQGVVLDAGNVSLINRTGGTITGTTRGAELQGNNVALTNQAGGVITGGSGSGVYLGAYRGSSATLDNSGTISGVRIGAYLHGAEISLVNHAGGTISGPEDIYGDSGYGVKAVNNGDVTFENAGTVIGAGEYGIAAYLGAGHSVRLIVDPGAVFIGSVYAFAPTGNTVLELKAGAAAGTIAGLGDKYHGFQTVTIDSGATWTVAGSLAGLEGSTIEGFTNRDLLDITDQTFSALDTVTFDSGSGVLTIDDGGGSLIGTLHMVGSNGSFSLTADSDGKLEVHERAFQIDSAVASGIVLTPDLYVDVLTVTYAGTVSGSGDGLSAAADWTIVNHGTIAVTGTGISLAGGGSVSNDGTVGGGGVAVAVGGASGTVENAGTIGGSTHAVYMGAATNRLIVDGGAVFNGDVAANPAGANTIELTSGAATGTLSGLGSTYLGFQTVTIDSGASWTVGGGLAAIEGTTIEGFTNRDVLDITDRTFSAGDTVTFDSGADLLTINDGAGSLIGTIQLDGSPVGHGTFNLTADSNGKLEVQETASQIDSAVAAGVVLTPNAYTDPMTVTATGTISSVNGIAVSAPDSWTVVNHGTILGGAQGIFFYNGGAIDNDGTIQGTGHGYYAGYGIVLFAGGTITNETGGTIGGSGAGVEIFGSSGTLVNDGVIAGGSYNAGVVLGAAGSLTNQADGQISGGDGVILSGGGLGGDTLVNQGTITGHQLGIFGINNDYVVINSGTISGAQAGIFIRGTIDNEAGGTINGIYSNYGLTTVDNAGTISTGEKYSFATNRFVPGHGVFLGFGGTVLNEHGGTITGAIDGVDGLRYVTVENAGTITGGTHAVYMGGVTNRLIVDAGAVFNGDVVAKPNETNVLELTSGAAAGTLSGLGSEYKNFQNLVIDSGATWTIAGSVGGIGGTVIDGFNTHDTLDLTDLTFDAGDTANLNNVTDVLTILAGDGTTVLDTIHLAGSFAGKFFHLSDGGSHGTYLTEDSTPCYLRGTRIRTPGGDRPVEDLKIGDLIAIHGGETLPLKWIGRRGYRDWLAVGNADAQPILFKVGSLADGVPARDLYVSPEHAMFLDGMLVPAHLLVNGRSIVKCEGLDDIEYFHLEFDRHAVILAEGAPAESFVDDDSRMLFHNADEYRCLYPDEPRRRFAEFCAPRVEDGPALAMLRQALAARAAHLRPGGAAAPWGRRGKVEIATGRLVAGWAFAGADAGPQPLIILLNGAVVGRVVADRYRADLEAAGIGDGRHGFSFPLPKGLAADADHRIEVRREVDWSPV
ncbi:MAG TPA: Hint domain-containing protein [Alphaproteobacteria bacterium]|nr:Hint domain-containing protein [Alphaproteobacteria bacterium]